MKDTASTPDRVVSPKLLDVSYRKEVIARLKREGRMPSLEQWCEAIAEARRKYQKAILEAREQSPPEEQD